MAAPVNASSYGREILIVRPVMEQLHEDFLRTSQPFCLAPLPMNVRINIVETLDPTPLKFADLNGSAVHAIQV